MQKLAKCTPRSNRTYHYLLYFLHAFLRVNYKRIQLLRENLILLKINMTSFASLSIHIPEQRIYFFLNNPLQKDRDNQPLNLEYLLKFLF